MKKLIVILGVFLLSSLSSCEYELSICTIFRDDAKYLPEWIEFHKDQGVEHFYLYNNLSTDNPDKILSKYKNDVTLIDWPFDYSDAGQWNDIQCKSYLHCVKNASSKWIAFLDTDEFLFCVYHEDLKTMLKEYDNYGSVSAHWMMYGTSNVIIPEGGKIVDYLVYRENMTNPHTKSIGQTKYITNVTNPHWVESTLPNFILDVRDVRINHYWSRDLWFFNNIKLPRREKWYHDTLGQIKSEKMMNEIYDPILSNLL